MMVDSVNNKKRYIYLSVVIKKIRRGIYARRSVKIGEKINLIDFAFLRPSISNDFLYIKKNFGKKIKKQKKQNQIIS